MTLLNKVEDRPTPAAVYNWRVYMLAVIASFASCTIGYDSAFIGTTLALPSFRNEFGFNHMQQAEQDLISANIVSLYQAGAFFGAIFAYAGGYFLGRRIGLIICAALFMVGAGVMLDATGSKGLGAIYGGRVLAGFAIGGGSNLVPMYISELAPPAIRGRLVGLYELGWQIGGLIGFWINYGVSETLAPSHSQWLIPFAVQLISGGMLLIGLFFVKESPRWLYSKGRREEGLRNLLWIRNLSANDIYIIEEVAMIDSDLEAVGSHLGGGFWKPWKLLATNRKVQWRFFIGTSLFMWQNATGINAINYYSPRVFASLGITGTNTSFFTTGLYGVVKTVLTFIFLLFLIDRVGRRNLLFIGSAGGAMSMFIIGALVKVQPPVTGVTRPIDSKGIAAVFFFYLWTVFYSPTWNPIPWILNSEIYDINTRALGQAFAAASNWFWGFIISRFTPTMFTKMSYGVYFFFASLMICSIPFVWFFIPETKSVPLESIDRLFAIKPSSKAHSVIMQELHERDREFREHIKTEGIIEVLEDEKRDSTGQPGHVEIAKV